MINQMFIGVSILHLFALCLNVILNNEASEVKNESETKNLCKRGCGFYGSVQFKDMCSKCYQEQVKCDSDLVRSTPIDLSNTHVPQCLNCTESIPIISPCIEMRAESSSTVSRFSCTLKRKAEDEYKVVEPTVSSTSSRVNRCNWCRKRVGLTGFLCRCEGLFCSLHRYSDQHQCTYDYQATGRIELARANPEVRCPKIRKL